MRISIRVVALCIVGVLTLGILLVQYMSQHNANRAVAKASNDIIDILREAERVIYQNRAFLREPCTPEVVRQLGRSAALSPRLRGVRLLHEGSTICSSLSGAQNLPTTLSRKSGGSLLLLKSGDELTPTAPVLVLVKRFPEGQVAVSLSGVFIQHVLRATASRPTLVFRVADQEMDYHGRVVPNLFTKDHYGVEGEFPFSLSKDPKFPPSGLNLVPKAFLWTLLSLVVVALIMHAGQRVIRCRNTPLAKLRNALQRGEIKPWYQPLVNGTTGEVIGCEVLARWHSRQSGIIPPDQFIPLAEQFGLIVPMTKNLLLQVICDIGSIRDELPGSFRLNFNISADHARDHTLLQTCIQLQKALPGVTLVAEITERERFELSPHQPEFLSALRAAGVKVALDDFGTGYAGLSELDRLPVDYIKLDRSFTAQITEGTTSGSERVLMAEMVAEMAHRLELEVVAEGVETVFQQDWLIANGVHWQQGYLFSRALPINEFAKFLRR